MCPNRVEELESRVQELEASVEGLTDELVECKVRLRELEAAVDEDLGFAPEQSGPRVESPEETEEATDPAEATKPEAPEEGEKAEDPEAEIIVA
jgi:predicted  nucleic acid-binding Zn-ribbon protein